MHSRLRQITQCVIQQSKKCRNKPICHRTYFAQKAKFAASKVSETGPDKLWKKVKLCQNASFPKNDTARFVSGNSLYYVSLQTLEPGECLDDQVSVVHLSQVVCSV